MEREAQPLDWLSLEQQVCFALGVATRDVVSLYRPLLEPLGLTHPQYLVMLVLWEGEPLSVKQLSELLKQEPPTLSPLLKRLEAAGLVERSRDPADERALRISLTPQGQALREKAEEIPHSIVHSLGLNHSELELLRTALTDLIERANASPDHRRARSAGRHARARAGATAAF